MYWFLHHFFFDPVRFPIAMLALTLTAIGGIVLGPLASNANPFFWRLMTGRLSRIGRRLDRTERTERDLKVRGGAVTVFGLLLAVAAGIGAQKIIMTWPFSGVTEIFLLSLTLCGGAVWKALLKLNRALKDTKKPAKGAYYTIAVSTHTDLLTADDYTITRVGMGFAARSFDKGVVAPVIWYIIAGLPGAYIYAGLAALSAHFARDGFTKGFGALALKLETLMGYVPNILAGILMALAGLFTPTGGMTRAIKGILRSEGAAPYAEGGLPLTAMAWSLKVNLGGPVQDMDGRSLKRQWVGPKDATARLEGGHLRRGLYISLMAYLLFMAALMGTSVGIGHLWPPAPAHQVLLT